MTGNQVHRIRPNHREWSPPQVICFDTETWQEHVPEGELHTLRLWSARLDVRRTRHGTGLGTSDGWGYSASELADQIEIWAEGQRTLWLYAHNLSFDLSVTRLPAILHARGWQVTGHAVASDSPWLRMKRGQCVLTFADSWGWLRAPLGAIGADVGYAKPDLPAWTDSDADWLARCQGDVEILARAMLQLMDWWDAEQLGSWTLTGSAGGWNTWRHRTLHALPLIVPGTDQTDADRAAIYGGRREAFRHGELQRGPFALLDFKAAYPTIASAKHLPSARQGNFESLPADSPLVCGPDYGIIAQVELDTADPRWPVRVNGRIAYPVGRFVTTLAGPEIAEARRLGCLVRIGPGWLHKLAPHMAQWARWVLDTCDDDSGAVPRVCQRAVKHWGRAVIGKTAARGWRTYPLESLGDTGWDYRPAWNAELQAPSHLTDICGVASETVPYGDADNAYPAILAWVESWTRVYLSRAIDAIGAAAVVTCDTDGLICSGEGDWTARLAAADLGPLTLRQKGTYQTVKVLGPQHVISDTDRKLSGIPQSAEPVREGKLGALLWPKMATQMNMRPGQHAAGYLRPWQTYALASSYVTGHVTAAGAVLPLVAAMCGDQGVHLLPLPPEVAHLFPADRQASHLAQICNPLPEKEQPCTYHSLRSNGITGGSSPSAPVTSSGSHRRRTSRGAVKRRSWLSTGGIFSALSRRVSSGWTRT